MMGEDVQANNNSDYSEIDSLELVSKKSFGFNAETTETLVIYCADPRFKEAFRQFIDQELGIGHHVLISVGGGAGPFVLFKHDSDRAKQMVNQLRLFIKKAGVKKLVVLNHTECKWYANTMPDLNSGDIVKKQIADLQRFSDMVVNEIENITVKTYLSVLEDERVYFRKVPTA